MSGLDPLVALNEHAGTAYSNNETRCRCDGQWRTHAEHRAHVAAVLREQIGAAMGEAWDEGRMAGSRDVATRADDWTPNPYRAAQVAPSCVPGEAK